MLTRLGFITSALTFATTAVAQGAPPAAPADPPEVASIEQLHREAIAARRELADAVLVDGLVGIVSGGALIPLDANDQAWRFAGINTAAFGVVNSIVASIALLGIGREARTWESDAERAARRAPGGLDRARIHAVLDSRRESVAQALNLGLDCAYLAVGATAILASQLGVDHPNRWLASGTAIGVQSLILVAIDLVGVMGAGRYHERFLRGFATSVSVTSARTGTRGMLGFGGQF
jgi:hypothetical protein